MEQQEIQHNPDPGEICFCSACLESRQAELALEVTEAMKNRILLIDADSICYILGWHLKDTHKDDYMKVVDTTDEFMKDMLRDTGCSKFIGFLGGVHPTFRHTLDPTYKGNRGPTKPDWYMQWGSIVKHRLRHNWQFYYLEGIEAEDGVSMMANYIGHNKVVLAHCDKDLNQIPGLHYDYKKKHKYILNPMAATYNYYLQVLMGDSTDNITGIPGIGPKKAAKILAPGSVHSNPEAARDAWNEATYEAYKAYYGATAMEKFLLNSSLVKILPDHTLMGFTAEKYTPFQYIVEERPPELPEAHTTTIPEIGNLFQ
jgi:5'-3' exonuclease